MEKKQSQIVTIDNIEYDANKFSVEQVAMFNHCLDLDRKISSTEFQLEQLVGGKTHFITLLKETLKDTPALVPNNVSKINSRKVKSK